MPLGFLDEEYWVTQDGRKLYPEKGEMDESHLRNTIRFIQRPEVVESYLMQARDTYLRYYVFDPGPSGMYAQDAFEAESDAIFNRIYVEPEEFIRDHLRRTRLWHALHNGLNNAVQRRQKAAKLNAGVLDGLEDGVDPWGTWADAPSTYIGGIKPKL